ncbi:MAG: DegV family protein [Clostridia bacterium]|nr:DegV family protein [Clostridia bacterium]
MKYKIFTDSTSDVTPEFAAKYGITVLPLEVIFEGTAYKAGIDITNHEFYVKLNDCLKNGKPLPTTSQVTEGAFEEALKPYANKEDTFVCLLLIGKDMSGTYSSALKAIESLGMKNVYAPDTMEVTFGLGCIVAEVAKIAQTDIGVEEFKATVDDYIDRAWIYASIGDLRCLRAGGRLSTVSMLLGTMLKLKPIIYVHRKVEVCAKVISQGKATRWIVDKIMEERDESMPLYLGSSEAEDILNDFRTKFKDQLKVTGTEEEFPLGPVVGVHAGPGCAGIAFFRKKK